MLIFFHRSSVPSSMFRMCLLLRACCFPRAWGTGASGYWNTGVLGHWSTDALRCWESFSHHPLVNSQSQYLDQLIVHSVRSCIWLGIRILGMFTRTMITVRKEHHGTPPTTEGTEFQVSVTPHLYSRPIRVVIRGIAMMAKGWLWWRELKRVILDTYIPTPIHSYLPETIKGA